jgi:hypothetical protein
MSQNCVSDFILKSITSSDSNSTARVTINENFRKIKSVVECINDNLGDLLNILPPINPNNLSNYVVQYNNGTYSLVEMSHGIKYRIRSNESIRIGEDYQYIVYDTLENYGNIVIDPGGQLIIL